MTNGKTTDSPWSSLEVCKLGATISTPIIVFVLGCVIWNAQRDVVQHWERDLTQQRSAVDADIKERDQVRQIRLSIYEKAAPLLDEILAYHFYVGRWKERSPSDLIATKRDLDSLIYSHRALLTTEFFARYHAFMREAFSAAGNHYGESQIRTSSPCRQAHLGAHAERWDAYFTGEDRRRELCTAYADLLGRVSEELLLKSFQIPARTDADRFCPPFYSDQC